jgi:hypothetical protein
MEQDERNEFAKRRFLEGIRNAPDRGTGGRMTWTREELHERSAWLRDSGTDEPPSPGGVEDSGF